jgi:hypothetical protein
METQKIIASIILAGITLAPANSLADVTLVWHDAEKPCARIDISSGHGRATASFSGCTRTPASYTFTQGWMREAGPGEGAFNEYVTETQSELSFGEAVHSGFTKGASRAFRVNLRTGRGEMSLGSAIGRTERYSVVCRTAASSPSTSPPPQPAGPFVAPYGKSICPALRQQYPNMPLRNCN